MYITLLKQTCEHITNITGITYDLTKRAYDLDSFTAEGISTEDVKESKILILNDKNGNYEYACFYDSSKDDNKKITLKGLDFKSLWNQEIILDYTVPNSFDGTLSGIFKKISALVFNTTDIAMSFLQTKIIIPNDYTDTTLILGSLQDTYESINAYKFLKVYLKYYEYQINSKFDISTNTIIFTFVKNYAHISLNLKDFIYELTTSSTTTNKTVATIKYEPLKKDADGNEYIDPREGKDIATVYYYLDKTNNIVQSNEYGNISNRIYPVVQKIYENEYLAKAQFDAVYELSNARYVDNIIIDNTASLDPIDFANYEIYTKIDLYSNGMLYKTLPISEKIISYSSEGLSIKVKLGFKKILLTEIIKG